MTRITIEVDNEAEEKRIREVLRKHHITYQEPSAAPTPNGQQIAELMQKLAESYSLNEIKDPVAWQREVRQDRPLPFRD